MGGEIASGHGRPGLLSSRTSGVPLPDHFFSDGFAAVGESLGGITDATPALIAYMDPGCRYRFVNAQYSLWFDRPREEILGLHMTEVLGVEAFRKLEPYLRKALKGEDVHFEMEVP